MRVAWRQEVMVAGEATSKQVEDESDDTAVRKQEVEADTYMLVEPQSRKKHDSVADGSD